jgi:hypothetical protein
MYQRDTAQCTSAYSTYIWYLYVRYSAYSRYVLCTVWRNEERARTVQYDNDATRRLDSNNVKAFGDVLHAPLKRAGQPNVKHIFLLNSIIKNNNLINNQLVIIFVQTTGIVRGLL